MCRMDTVLTNRTSRRLIVGLTFCCQIAVAQAPALRPARASVWRKLGNDAVAMNLAGPASGPIAAVWYSPAGDRIFVRTRSGQVLETANYATSDVATSDIATWAPAANQAIPQPLERIVFDVRGPEPGARVQVVGSRLFSLGTNLQVSEDAGQTWTNLTAYQHQSVIGSGQHSVAVSPLDPRQVVVANDFGVWRSADGGLSWISLNDDLPNLPIRRLLPSATPGTLRAQVEGIGTVELPPASAAAHANWIRSSEVQDSAAGLDEMQRRDAGAKVGALITALAHTATTWFAGSVDGRFWTSFDNGGTWNASPQRTLGRIEVIQAGGDTPAEGSRSALAVVASGTTAGPRLLRTTSAGTFWEDLSAGLPEGGLHGVAVDVAAGVAYVAGDRGVFTAKVDMVSLVPVSQWQKLDGLPEGPAMDVRLDTVRNNLYVAVDGYGLYVTPAPHRSAAVRVLTAADQPAQSAAPGVLLHVEGAGVSRVRAETGDVALVASSESSTQFQIPFEASGPMLALMVDSQQGQSRVALPLRTVAPSILVDADGLPILVNAATGLTLDSRNVARAGSRIQVFAAGLGKVNPEWRTGIPAPEEAPVVVAKVEARLDGNPVEVTHATLAPGYVGLYLVEVQLPGLVNAGAADFSLVVNGETSNHVRILLSVD